MDGEEKREENGPQTEENRQEPVENGGGVSVMLPGKGLLESGYAFTAGAVFIVVLSLVQALLSNFLPEGEGYPDWYVYLLYFLPQLAFCGAAALYLVRTKQPVKTFYPKTKLRFFPIALLLQFGLLLSLSVLNEYFVELLGLLGYQSAPSPVPSSMTGWNLFFSLFLIALLPAVFEELLFRGILLRGMQDAGWGLVPTLLISGALFSLYHGNPEQTIYQFICGVCFAFMAIRAGSLFPSMLAHFANNAAVLLLTGAGFGDFREVFGGTLYLVMIILSALCLVGTLLELILLEKRGNRKGGIRGGARFFAAAAGGIAICAIEWIAALWLGFSGAV